MTKICTDVRQSKNLVINGIDINSADMYWMETSIDYYTCGVLNRLERKMLERSDYYKMTPAWTSDALMRIMPPVKYEDKEYQPIGYYRHGKAFVNYENIKDVRPLMSSDAEYLVDAAYGMMTILFEQGYIKNEDYERKSRKYLEEI